MAWHFPWGCPPSSSKGRSPVCPTGWERGRTDRSAAWEWLAHRPGWQLEPMALVSRSARLVGVGKGREGALHALSHGQS